MALYYEECGECSFVSFSHTEAKEHAASCSVLKGCSRCEFTTTSEAALVAHREQSGHGCFACNLCPSYYSATPRGMAVHKQQVHQLARPSLCHESERLYDASVGAGLRRPFDVSPARK